MSLTKDTGLPTVTITSPVTGTTINSTNESSLLVSGTCSESGRTVSLSHGAGSLTCNSGTFSGNIDFSAVADGSFSLTASQTDSLGNIGTSSAVNLTKDTGLPTVTITSPVTGSSINTANESSLLVSGTCSESGRTVSLSHGVGYLICNGGNSFSGNINFSAVADGSFSLTASQTDSLGNIGTSSAVNLTKDTGLPTVTITSPSSGTSINTVNESSLLVSGTCSESGRAVILSHGTGSLTCNGGNFSGNIDFSAVADGSFSLTASQTDASNNTATSSAVNLTKDTGLPTVTITSPVTGSSINAANESSLLVSGTCSESGRAVTLSHGSGSLTCNSGNFSGNINFSAVADGSFSLTASQTDASNNTATSSAVNLTKDTGLPTVTITSPVTGTTINATNESSLLVSGTCSESGRTVSLSHGTGSLTCNGGNFSGNIDFSAVSDGTFSLTASQTDASNNTATSSAVSLTKDTGLPTVTIASPVTGTSINTTNESSLLVSGTCSESGRTVSLSHGTGTLTCNSGNFSGNINFSAVADGSFSLTASQMDASNNTATSSAVNLTKDTGLPTVTIASPVTGTSINTANESSLLVSGTCSESGRAVSLSHGSGSLTCNGGTFSGNIDFSAVSDGTFSLTASQTDASNNTATSSAVTLTKDTGLPTVTITSPSSGTSINTTNESSLLVSGTCSESGRAVTLSHGSGSLTCNGGTFSGNIDFSAVSDGTFSLTASQTDASNNTATSSAVTLTKDTGLPTVTITSPSSGTSINTTNESSLLVSGTCSESGRAVTLSQGLGALNCNSGNFSGNIDFSSLSDGAFSLTASQTDSLGNIGTSSAVNLTKDTGLPTVTITSPSSGTSINTTNESSLLVSGTCSESGRTVSLSHGSGSLTCNGGNFSGNIDFSSLSDGSFSLTASQTDASNNTATSSAVNLTKDTGLPTVTITSPSTGSSINAANESSLLVSGTCSESGRAVTLSQGLGALNCNSGNFSGNINFSSLSDGAISLTASQTDSLGNIGISSAVNLTKDTGLPAVTITSPVAGTSINAANESSLLVSGTCSESGQAVSLSHGSGSLTCNGGNFSGNIDFSAVSDGAFSLTASQTDSSNNTATSSAVSLTKDTGLPTVTITSPVNGTSINAANESSLLVRGTCSESGRTVSLSHGVGYLICNSSNSFSGNIDFSAVADGSLSLTASQTDASNNTATSSAVNLTKDTGLPTVTITSPSTGSSINAANESSLLVSGTCSESGRTVSLSHGSGSLTCNGGNFSGNVDFSSLSDGSFSLTASQTDASNNTATSSAVNLTKDTGLPTVTITSPVTGTSINTANESSLLVSGTCSENGRTVSLSHGTGSLTCNGGNFSGNINFSSLSDGSFSLTASQTDSLGNIGTSSAVNLTKDTGLPTVTITSPVTGTTINSTNESSLLVSGTCSENGRAVSLSHGTGSLTCNSSNNFSGNINFSTVSDGTFSLTASQTNASNNTGTSSAVNLIKFTEAPTVTITSPVADTLINTTNESSLLVSGTCSEDGRTVSLSHGTGYLTCNSSNNFSGNINFSTVSDGSFSLTASQTDAFRNTGTSSAVSLTKDTALPTVTISSPVTGTTINSTNESSLLVSGTCSENGRTVSLSHGTGSLTCNGGNFSGNINFSSLSDGTFSLTASQTNASNNTGTSSAVSLTKSTVVLPTVTISSPVADILINTTNESSLLVSGTCSENGRAVTLSHGSGSLTCNSDSFSGNIDFSSIADGTISLTASQTDADGNTGTSSAVNLTKDTRILPVVTLLLPSEHIPINTTNESSLFVRGTCSEGGRVSLSHGTGILNCRHDDTFFGFIDFSSIADGTISLTASQTNAEGHTGTSNALNLTKDTTPPTVTIASPVTGSAIITTNESSLLVSGTCSENGRTVSLSHGVGTLTCNAGNFSGNINFSSLEDGMISLTASQTDSASNTGTSSAVSLTKNTRPIIVTLTNPATGSAINARNASNLLVSGTCSEDGLTVSLSHGTGALTCSSGSFSGNIDFRAVADGTFSLTASQTDAFGNIGTSSAVSLTKDTRVPTVAITSPTTGTSITSEANLLVSGTCSEDGRAVTLSHGLGSLTCNSGSFSGSVSFSPLSDGVISLTASQTDSAGNRGTSSSVSLTKNSRPTTVTITSPTTGSAINTTNESSLLVTGTCSEGGRAVSLSHGSGSLTCNQSGQFSGRINFSAVSDGTFSLTASQTDFLGNIGTSSSVRLTKDTRVPTVTITSPVSGSEINAANVSSFLVEGTCSERGRTVSLSHGTGSLTCSSGGQFSGRIDFSSVSDGVISLTASQTDRADNTATSNAVSLTKDTGEPTVTLTGPANGTAISTTNASSLSVSGTCSENGQAVSLSHGTGSLTCNGGSFSGNIDFSAVADGDILLTASQTNALGNTGTSNSVSLTKDATPPTITITSPVAGTSISSTNESSLLVSGTCSENGLTVSLSHGSGSLTCNSGSFSSNIDFSALSDGAISLTASQTDAFGNIGTSSAVSLTKGSAITGGTMTSVWRISRSNEQVELPLKSGFNYNFRVNWGDGSPESIVTSYNDTDKAHTYASSGDYTITITGLVEGWGPPGHQARPYHRQIIEVSDLGDMGWKDLSFAFVRCTNLTAVSGGNTANVTNMRDMFYNVTSANPDVSSWNTSKVTNMNSMFHNARSANPDTSNWDTSKVIWMSNMFYNARSANPDTSNWDTSKVIYMNSMFHNATSANPDVSNWDTSKVTNMEDMFYNATSANPDVSNWDTSKVTNMEDMFYNATSANLDVRNWDTSKVTTMRSMFRRATSANPDVSNWDTSKVTTMSGMFASASAANPDVSRWDTSKVIWMLNMFSNARSANPDTSNWDTSKVRSMYGMFSGATSANPDVSNWDTSKVTNMSNMFARATSANPDTRNWDTSKVRSMYGMFSGATSANPDVSNFDFTALRVGTNYGNFSQFIHNSGISTLNYSNLLINLDSQEIHESVIEVFPEEPFTSPAQYNSSAAAARASLLNKGWIINDRGRE